MGQKKNRAASSQWVDFPELVQHTMKLRGLDRQNAKRLLSEHRLACLRPVLVHRSGECTVVHDLSDQSYTQLTEATLLNVDDFKRLNGDTQSAVANSDISWSIPTIIDWVKRCKLDLKIESHIEWMRDVYPSLKERDQIYGAAINNSSTNKTPPPSKVIDPRFVRLRDAPGYLGMNKNKFNAEVRPEITVIKRPGERGIYFDRVDLDNFANKYKKEHGQPVASTTACLKKTNRRNKQKTVSSNAGKSGTSTSTLTGGAYAAARAQLIKK